MWLGVRILVIVLSASASHAAGFQISISSGWVLYPDVLCLHMCGPLIIIYQFLVGSTLINGSMTLRPRQVELDINGPSRAIYRHKQDSAPPPPSSRRPCGVCAISLSIIINLSLSLSLRSKDVDDGQWYLV
ncbi:hypothetical protein BDN70DRAFT_386222 [Pholiota conissans]|uniref:Uncharacterized protein n=1 Tax=Pholiota conissans TaxID=109636 RepID=A0A9P5YSZ3_9AGAR|nr:hypothetical protein BDN70DRAFT_386222 [Pholiota conissans]